MEEFKPEVPSWANGYKIENGKVEYVFIPISIDLSLDGLSMYRDVLHQFNQLGVTPLD